MKREVRAWRQREMGDVCAAAQRMEGGAASQDAVPLEAGRGRSLQRDQPSRLILDPDPRPWTNMGILLSH